MLAQSASVNIQIDSPASQQAGVGIIYQEFNQSLDSRLVKYLPWSEASAFSWIGKRHEHEQAKGLFSRIGVPVNPDAFYRDLTVLSSRWWRSPKHWH